MSYKDYILSEQQGNHQYNLLLDKFRNAMDEVGEFLNYEVFARVIGTIISEDYGSHLKKNIIEIINKQN